MGQVKSIKGTIYQVIKSNCCNKTNRKASDSSEWKKVPADDNSSDEEDFSATAKYVRAHKNVWNEQEWNTLKEQYVSKK